jgi:C4-dicarboxylate transporter, DctM subunit
LYYARRKNFPSEPELVGTRLRLTWHAAPAMAVPFVVLAGIYGGVITVTESAALAAATALLVSLFVYRGFPLTRTLSVIAEALCAAVIMLIIATALVFGHWMTGSGIPGRLVDFAAHQGLHTWELLLTVNVLLPVIGFLEVISTLLL